jgi:hypothetical protein
MLELVEFLLVIYVALVGFFLISRSLPSAALAKQPVLKLLWHVPHRTSMRRGQGNRTTYLTGQLRACLGIDNHAELREIVDLYPAVEFNKWTTSRFSARWNHWGVRPPRGPAQNIAEVFSPAEGSPLPTLYELFGTPSEDPHPTT